MNWQGLLVTVFLGGVAVGYSYGLKAESKAKKAQDFPLTDDERCKMVLVVRKDLPITKGKIAAQCGHAAVACFEKASLKCPHFLQSWRDGGQAKIALQCSDLSELRRLEVRASRLGLVACSISDAGHTQIDPGTVTVLGIGPAPEKLINEITGDLKLL